MAVTIQVMDKNTIEEYAFKQHKERSIIISIASYNVSHPFIQKNTINNIVDVLFLSFNDTLYDNIESGAISDDDANKIFRFIRKHKDDNIDTIIFQCEEDYSRSAGCAAAVEKEMLGTVEILSNPEYVVNNLCYNKVLECFKDSDGMFDAYLESKEQTAERLLAEKLKTSINEKESGFVDYEDIIADISRGIAEKSLKAGTELPDIAVLADAMNKSNYTVWKAYDILCDEGLIRRLADGHYIVTGDTSRCYNDTCYKEIEKSLADIVKSAKSNEIPLDRLITILINQY